MSKVENIVLLSEVPFRERDHLRFGVGILKKNFNVKVLDCTAWLQPKYWEKHSSVRYEFPGYHSVTNWEEFQKHFLDLSGNTIVVDYLFETKSNEFIWKWLKSKKIPRVVVYAGLFPKTKFIGFNLKRIRAFASQVRDYFKILLYHVQLKFCPSLLSVCFADMAVVSGESALKHVRANAPKLIWAHSFDYDVYLSLKGQSVERPNCAVFLDQDLVYHPGLVIAGVPPYSTAEEYYPAMNRFFDEFEAKTGFRVVIAAHPRARYDLRPELFPNREIITGQTLELVRDCELVFAHHSTSISIPVLWQKPVVLLTTNSLQKSRARPNIQGFRDCLNAPLINADTYQNEEIDLNSWKNFSKAGYERYKKLYVKMPGTPEKLMWEIFTDYIQNHFV